jgi:thiol-disulfide isomerase/thioredoxin
LKDSSSGSKFYKPVKKNGFLLINKSVYKFIAVDIYNNEVVFEKLSVNPDSIYFNQLGLNAPGFTEAEFTTGRDISLEKCKGKYVLLDFWGSWCAPCIEIMPALHFAYSKLDKNKIEFIGIISRDNRQRAIKAVADNEISWPQIFADSANKIISLYNIDEYPSFVLINPDGMVVAQDLYRKVKTEVVEPNLPERERLYRIIEEYIKK